MIDNLKISYELDRDISVILSTETGYDDNLPHNLAAVFAKVVKDSRANKDMVIENLKTELDNEFEQMIINKYHLTTKEMES